MCCIKGGEWLRVAGELARDENRESEIDMLEYYLELRVIYSAEDDNTEVLYFKNVTRIFSNFTTAPKVVKF